MTFARREILAGLGASAAIPTFAAEPARTLSPKAMRADLALLRDADETLHPGFYHYRTLRQVATQRGWEFEG